MATDDSVSIRSVQSAVSRFKLFATNTSRLSVVETTSARTLEKVYRKLRDNEFRLLDIVACNATASSCQLRIEQLRETGPSDPDYIAVSYSWHSQSGQWQNMHVLSPHLVKVNGHSWSAASRAGPMISHLHTLGHRTLWIDAICIDQHDLSERGHQVAHMREIYSSATKVVVFLGTATLHTDAFFASLNGAVSTGPARLSDEQFQGLMEVIDNPYWQRAWILQELAVARKVELLCGTQRVNWETFLSVFFRSDVLARIERPSSGSGFPGSKIRIIDEFRTVKHRSLTEILANTRWTQASDPLDIVYAKLGLAHDAKQLVPRANYRLDLVSLLKSIIKTYIKMKHNIYIICLVGAQHRQSHTNMPSWLPDWTLSTNIYPLLRFHFTQWMNTEHVRHPRMKVSFGRNMQELRISGRLLDTIGPCNSATYGKTSNPTAVFSSICRTALADHCVLPHWSQSGTISKSFITLFAQTIHRLADEATEDSAATSVVHESSLENAARDLQEPESIQDWDDAADIEARQVSANFRRWYMKHYQITIAGMRVSKWASEYLDRQRDLESVETMQSSTGGIEKSLANIGWHRLFVETQRGRPALVPDTTKNGDVVCILYGCPVPVILRQVKDHYIFVGECYVDDFMDTRHTLNPTQDTVFRIL